MGSRYCKLVLFVLISVTNADAVSKFSYPAGATTYDLNSSTVSFAYNPVFKVGDPQKILWTTEADSVRLALWQNGSATTSNIEEVLCKECSDESFDWDGHPAQDISKGAAFFLVFYNTSAPTVNGVFHYIARSRYFNMTDPSTSSSSSVSATSTTGPSSSSTGTVATTTPSSSPTSVPSAGSKNDGAKIGLGVGLGVGIIALSAGFFLFRFLRKKKDNTDSSHSTQNNGRVSEPPPRYFKAELPYNPKPEFSNQLKPEASNHQAGFLSSPDSAIVHYQAELPSPASNVIHVELPAQNEAWRE